MVSPLDGARYLKSTIESGGEKGGEGLWAGHGAHEGADTDQDEQGSGQWSRLPSINHANSHRGENQEKKR